MFTDALNTFPPIERGEVNTYAGKQVGAESRWVIEGVHRDEGASWRGRSLRRSPGAPRGRRVVCGRIWRGGGLTPQDLDRRWLREVTPGVPHNLSGLLLEEKAR